MIQEKLARLKDVMQSIDKSAFQLNTKIDSIDLISSRLSQRPKKTLSQKSSSKQFTAKPTSRSENYSKLKKQFHSCISYKNLQVLYKKRCIDMKIQENQSSWNGFLKTFKNKNIRDGMIDFSGFSLGQKAQEEINRNIFNDRLREINLSRNKIVINKICKINACKNLQVLYLDNCGLHNQQLDLLFNKIGSLPIKVLSLSSPDLKDRNNLTKYEGLCNFIEKSKTLHTLQLSNIQISPINPIFQACRNSDTIKRLNLSKNTGVSGICKQLQQLDLSWNSIQLPDKLKIKDSKIKKLNLCGNPIPQYLIEQFMIPLAFPQIMQLNLNNIVLSHQIPILQNFIQKSHNLQKLELVSCQLTKSSMKFIFYGIQANKNLKILNISKNKFPNNIQIIQIIENALHKSHLIEINMHQCQIADQAGAIIFSNLKNWFRIRQIDISKNYLSSKTSNKLCQQLKNGCQTVLKLYLQQNIIKYDQLKQIYSYVGRNIHINRIKIRKQYNYLIELSTNTNQLSKKIQENQQEAIKLEKQTMDLEDKYINTFKLTKKNQKERLENELQIMDMEQKALKTKIEHINEQIQKIQEKIDDQEQKALS